MEIFKTVHLNFVATFHLQILHTGFMGSKHTQNMYSSLIKFTYRLSVMDMLENVNALMNVNENFALK